MLRSFLFFLSLTFTLNFAVSAASAQPDKKAEAIYELIEAMNTMENMETSLSTMKDTIKMNAPYFLKEVKVILSRELNEKDVNLAADAYRENEFGAMRLYELFRYKFNLERVEKEIMVPVYREHYTEDEIRQLTAFYKSDLGKKTLRLNPVITGAISSKTRDMSQMALNQAKEELAHELKQGLKK